MAVWSEVTLSKLQYSRLDGEFYSPKYIKEDEVWSRFSAKHNIEKLGRLISVPVRTGSTPKNRFVGKNDNAIHFVKTNTLREGRIDYPNCDFLPERVLRKSDFIPNEAVLVTIIGATPEIVGRTAIVRDSDPERVTNQNVAVIQTNNKLDAYYLTAYFQTKYGRDQLWRHSRRTEQVNLNCREVERVLVPFIELQEQRQIGELVRKSFSTLDLSKSLYVQAQELLEKELGLDMLVFPATLYSESSFVSVINGHRLDAQHYQNKFNILIDHLHKFPIQKIRKIRTVNRRGLQPKYIENGDFSVVNSQHITSTHLAYDNFERTSEAEYLRAKAGHILKDDVLIYTTGAYIGQTNLYDSEDPAMASNHVNVLRINGVDSAYLTMVLQSIVGKYQTQMHARGSAQAELYPSDIDKFFIPLLDDEKQLEIGNLLRQSLLAKRESENLLGEAKIMVEELIEGAI